MAFPAHAGTFEEGYTAYQRGEYAKAAEIFRPLAEQGNIKALSILGHMHEVGMGVPQDYAEAIKFYRMAAELGDVILQVVLASDYYGGKHVPQDYSEALKWFRMAAEQDSDGGQGRYAQYFLGRMHFLGEGVPEDSVLAYMWFDLAARSGWEKALDARKELEAKMSRDQITDAKRMAREWAAKHSQ